MFKNVRKEEITIPAQMSYLVQVRDFVDRIGRKYRFSDKVVNSFKLVIDEACTNLIRHGYRDIKNGEIQIIAIVRRLSLTMIIVDQGRSYDPRKANTPDLAKYVDIGKKGGLGILMMRKLMDDMQYSVTERGNEFRLTKYREAAHESRIKQYWHSLTMRTKYSLVASLLLTVLAALIFTMLYLNVYGGVRNEVLTIAASSCRSLADNAMEDLLTDNVLGLFEKSRSTKQNNDQIIDEALVVTPDMEVEARSNPLRDEGLGTYELPENAVLTDSLRGVKIYKYLREDGTQIYDLKAEIRQTLVGEGDLLGYAHVWVSQSVIDAMSDAKKNRLILFLVLILIAGYVLTFFLINSIISPFQSLAEWVRQVTRGKLDQDEIDIDASDELGEIAQAFNEMTVKFREAQVNLMEQQKLQKELQVAQEIQQMLLPSDFPKVEGYEIASYYEAAKEVGGDLFDFVEVDDDSIGICVADVSGKGVPGSLIMTMIRTALRLESRGNKNPADVLARVNRFVADDMKRGMFVTMFYIILDSRNRIIHYASAGHNPMILFRGSTKQTYYLNPSGFPVGIQLPDPNLFAAKIETDSIRLREDDILVLYTDGITEAMNAKRDLYKEERFLDAIRRNAHYDVGEFVKSINSDLKDFTGGAAQNDDITFVAVKEKLMQGEVLFRIHEELMQLIKQGVTVKEACDHMRVSPYYYYKYKDIVTRKGMDGLKSYLYSQDHIEKKHLSIELKTKMFDIIRKNPAYGAKRISNELAKEEYGSLNIDHNRIYEELKKLRLNTKEQRERYLEKGGRKRLKQPGTPLLTLDGQVIIDFESSEKEVGRRTGKPPEATLEKPREPEEKKEKVVRQITTSPAGVPGERDKGKAPATFIHKQAKPHEPVAPKEEKPAAEKIPQPEPKPETKPEPEPEPKPEEKAAETATPPPVEETVKPVPAEPETKDRAFLPEQAVTQDELLDRVTTKIDPEKLNRFYEVTADDLQNLEDMGGKIDDSESLEEDLKKINFILKIITKHPILKELPDVKHVFEQIRLAVEFMYEHLERLDRLLVVNKIKELLNYLQKDNKFKDYSKLFEAINSIGIIYHQLKENASVKAQEPTDEMDRIRKKLSKRNIITNESLLESLSRNSK